MQPNGQFCPSSLLNGEPVELCPPLAQLKLEHQPLSAQMDEFSAAAALVGEDDQIQNWHEPMKHLRVQIKDFSERLHRHSEVEEGFLFPMMATYIGRDNGPIAVMEYEHDQAKEQLALFLAATDTLDELGAPLAAEAAMKIASHAIAARQILVSHFMKEETILFPMAEKLLSDAEKNQLAEIILQS